MRLGPADDKATWRRWAAALPSPDDRADAVAAGLRSFLAERSGIVGGYVAIDGEVPIHRLLEEIADVALPRLGANSAVTWHRADGPLERHRHGMLEPAADAPEVAPADLAVVLVPGRVFDRGGIRLGRGGGHYDRMVPRLRTGVPTVGVTVEERVVERLPAEPHDAPMTHLATETGVRVVAGASGQAS